MLIKSIRLKDIRSYKDETIVFPKGTTLLSGDIGCGKSTILMATEFALFGLQRGELSGNDLLRYGADSGSVLLNFSIDGKDISIERTLRRKSGITQESGTLSINGVQETLTPVELKAKILEIIGYPQELLKKKKPIFRYTVYTPQEEMKQILHDSTARMDVLRKIFDIDKYSTIRNNTRIFITELRAMRRELDYFSQDLDEKKKHQKTMDLEITKLNKDLEEISGEIAMITAELTNTEKACNDLKKEVTELRKIRLDFTRKEAELNSTKTRLDKLTKEITEMEEKIESNRKLMENTPDVDIDQIMFKIKEAEKERDDLLKETAILDSETRKMSSIYEKGVCSFCGQEVHDPASYKKKIDDNISRKERLNLQKNKIDSLVEHLKKDFEAAKMRKTIEKNIGDLENWKENKIREREDAGNLIRVLEDSVEKLGKLAEAIAGKEKEYEEMEKLRSYHIEKLSAKEKNKARIEQQLNDLTKRRNEMEGEIRKMEEARKKINRISEMLSWFDKFLFLTEVIEKHVMITIQKEFNEYFQQWFSLLMGDVLSVRIDEKFTPVIEQNGYETSFSNLSGGEKTSVSLAYRLALNKVINIMIDSIRTKDLLILDEPTDGFSTEQLDKLRDVINALGLSQIIIVSHEPKIDTFVENVIKVYKENHVSRVVAV